MKFRAPRSGLGWAIGLWLVVGLLAFVMGPRLTGVVDEVLVALGYPSPLRGDQAFADTRVWLVVPNAMDVLSNGVFLAIGVWGMKWLGQASGSPKREVWPARLTCIGAVLTGIGSSVYHWAPMPTTLAWDRIGMAITFAGVLGWVVAQRLPTIGVRRFSNMVAIYELIAAVWPVWSSNAIPWAVLQFGGLAFVAFHAAWPHKSSDHGFPDGRSWRWVVGLYLLAKALELWDAQVLGLTLGWVSGHTLKHLVAAAALWPLLGRIKALGTMRGEPPIMKNARAVKGEKNV